MCHVKKIKEYPTNYVQGAVRLEGQDTLAQAAVAWDAMTQAVELSWQESLRLFLRTGSCEKVSWFLLCWEMFYAKNHTWIPESIHTLPLTRIYCEARSRSSNISYQLSDCNKAGLASNALLGILRLSTVRRVQVSLPTSAIISGVWLLF